MKQTAEEYRTLPDTGSRYQLVDGELWPMPSPSWRHQVLQAELLTRLRSFAAANRLGSVVGRTDVQLTTHDVFQPDVLFVAAANVARIGVDGVRGPPDLVVEVLSASTRHLDQRQRKRAWAEHGVPELWLVDPEEESITRYELQTGPPEGRTLSRGAITTPLLPGFTLDVREYFESA